MTSPKDQGHPGCETAASKSLVSILLPTYNRAGFLPRAFESIRRQTTTDWELVVVDDGSTDDTEVIVRAMARDTPQVVTLVKQSNAGPYAARNRALDLARASYVAFYDSDDVWLPHHLANCLRALEGAPDVDWVYGSCRIVEHDADRVVVQDTFRTGDADRPFLQLHTSRHGALHVFDDPRTLEVALLKGLYCGLQNSVLRRSVFATERFRTGFRNEAEDQLFLVRSLKRGVRVGYLDDVHVEYHVHGANSSGAALDERPERKLSVYRPVARGFEELLSEGRWTRRERRAIRRRVAREHFWHIGYSVLWQGGRRDEALESYRTGLRAWPWSFACWKTYLLARLRRAAA